MQNKNECRHCWLFVSTEDELLTVRSQITENICVCHFKALKDADS